MIFSSFLTNVVDELCAKPTCDIHRNEQYCGSMALIVDSIGVGVVGRQWLEVSYHMEPSSGERDVIHADV